MKSIFLALGEIFRYLSYTEDIGTKAMASRAEAGVNNNTLMFSVPGSVGAVTLAMSKLIIPEMAHLVREITNNMLRLLIMSSLFCYCL